jgi:hypothetical protein
MSLSKIAVIAVSAAVTFASFTVAPATAQAGDWCFLCTSDAPPPPPVRRTYRDRVVVEPGEYSVVRRPSVYGRKVYVREGRRWVPYEGDDERVLLRPYKNVVLRTPPVIRHTRERYIIQPEGE